LLVYKGGSTAPTGGEGYLDGKVNFLDDEGILSRGRESIFGNLLALQGWSWRLGGGWGLYALEHGIALVPDCRPPWVRACFEEEGLVP